MKKLLICSIIKVYNILKIKMIPIKNKKKSFEDTVQEMREFSMKYVEKYAPSKQQLRT